MAIGPLAVDMYLPAMPTLQSQFAVDASRVQHTLSAYLLGLAIGQLGFGPIADRYGRKPPLIGGLVVSRSPRPVVSSREASAPSCCCASPRRSAAPRAWW